MERAGLTCQDTMRIVYNPHYSKASTLVRTRGPTTLGVMPLYLSVVRPSLHVALYVLTALPLQVLEDADASQYVDGTAVHWYDDDNTGPEVMDQLHDLFPDKFILYTEACDGECLEGKTRHKEIVAK